MALAALLLYTAFFLSAFILRPILLKATTGTAGFRSGGNEAGWVGRVSGVLFVLAAIAGFLAPILAMTGQIEPIGAIDPGWLNWVGLVVAVVGSMLALLAQGGLGTEWRVGVDPEESTELVTAGLYRYSRNPFFSGVLVLALGMAMVVPSPVALVGLAFFILGIELQVRVVEEPHLTSLHGDRYREYAARVGRFAPGVGRLEGRR
jgi:protein-S-isoprenylcysteine O-methyltransferase Ste14